MTLTIQDVAAIAEILGAGTPEKFGAEVDRILASDETSYTFV